ncbi:MAG: hypothetical protein HYV24_05015 [Deltaproteobacteria bacterium]|nr:hypothetical protein [Deltaproteobacteria bacterium]
MNFGLNQNISLNGEVYHIQTEDGGRKNPVVTTVLFKNGAILASKKTAYEEILGSEKLDVAVGEIMREQHTLVLKQLKSGLFEKKKFEEGKDKGCP